MTSLADLLRTFRARAGLSQESLAERANLSVRTISDLERGIHHSARRTTVDRIISALALAPADARLLTAAATAHDARACQPIPAGLRQRPVSPLVGRSGPLSTLEAAANASRGGRGGIVAIVGDSGIGKTGLVRELVAKAAPAGDLVMHGRLDGPDAPPLRAIRTALGDLIGAQGPALVAARAGWAAPHLASLLPELRAVAGPPAPIAHRSDVFDASAALLQATFSHQPGIIVIDDVSWADEDTWMWIEHIGPLLPDLSLLLALVGRTGPLSSADADRSVQSHLAQLARVTEVEVIELGGLDRAAVAALVRTAGITSAALVTRIAEISEGNPLLVDAMAKQLAGRTRSYQERLLTVDASWPTAPIGIRTLVDAQLDELTPSTAHMVEVASVIGPDIETGLLAALAGPDPDSALISCLDEAAKAGILEPFPSHGHDRWTFRHPIVRSAAAERMGPARRAAIHHAAADRLWPLDSPLSRSADTSRVATHLVRGLADGADPCRALDACNEAAAQATAVHAWDAAAAWSEQAVAVARRLADRMAQIEALLHLGTARIRNLQRHLARPALLEAAELALQAGRLDVVAEAAEGYARMTKAAPVDPRAGSVWSAALDCIATTSVPDESVTVAVLAATAIDASLVGDVQASTISADVMTLARRAGPSTFPMAATTRSIALWPTPSVTERLEVADQLIGHAQRFEDEQALLEGLEMRGVPLLQLGNGRGFDDNLERLAIAAGSQHHRLAKAQVAQWRAMRALMVGDFDVAAHHADEAIERAGDAPNFTQGWTAQQFAILRGKGQHLGLLDRLQEEAAKHPELPAWTAIVAAIAAEAGETAVARNALDRLLPGTAEHIDPSWTRLTTLVLCAEAAWRLDDHNAAAILWPVLVEYDGQLVVVASGTSCEGAVAGYLALLAATLGRPEQASDLMSAAEELEREADGSILVARTRATRAELQLQIGGEPLALGVLGDDD